MVYLGIQESLNREVAIKILEPKLLKNDVIAKRFRREAKAAAHLSHSNIIQIIDVGKFNNHHYIIMEYLRESLKDRMKANPGGNIEPQIALKIVQAIMGALKFAHSRKIYHRDIKPDNIMFRADNTPVLVDFGVARILGFTDVGELTKSGQSMGTVYYMSPEQCQAQVDVDGRSDIYSLGAVLFEMLTGEKPYEGDSMVSVAVKHVQEPVPKLPQELRCYQPLIDKMMAKNRRKRLSSEKQLQQMLDKIMTGIAKHTRQPKGLNSAPGSKKSAILSPKKPGGALKKSPIKKKLVFWILPVVVVLVVSLFLILFRPGSKITKQDISYTDIHKLFVQDIPYHIGLSIVHELYKTSDLKSLEGAQYLVNKLKEIKISTEINELEEKIANRIELEKKFDKYLANARNYFKRKNFSKSRENILLAKKIKITQELVTFEEELKEAELKKQQITLRSKYKTDLNDEVVKSMIKKYKFFDANLNKTGAFKSYCGRKARNGEEVVIDYTTGLIWYNGDLKAEMNLKESEEWIEKLNSDKYGGYGDWRLPTLEEAASLLRKDKNKQGYHIHPIFSGSTSKILTKDQAPKKFLRREKFWVVCFESGNVEVSSKAGKYHIRPVCSLKR